MTRSADEIPALPLRHCHRERPHEPARCKVIGRTGLGVDNIDLPAAKEKNIVVTYDPIASSLVKSADAAYKLGFLEDEPKLDGIYALDLLNEVLQEKGLDAVTE